MEENRMTPQQAEEQVAALRREAAETTAALSEAYSAGVKEYERAVQAAKFAKKELDDKRMECERLRNQIKWKQADLQRLRGLFSGKRRRELETVIDTIRRALGTSEAQLAELEERCARKEAAVPAKPVAPELPDERKVTYQCAGIYARAGLYAQAAREYGGIFGYRDVQKILERDENIAAAADAALLAQLQPGSVVTFGHFRQKDSSLYPEPIEWIVLENDGETARLLSRYALFTACYNPESTPDVTWETCSLRRRLNDVFLDQAFSKAEQAKLATVRLPADDNPKYPSQAGNPTEDRAYLLSCREYEECVHLDGVSPCYLTQRGISQYVKESDSLNLDNGTCSWWLRTPGETNNLALYSSWPGNPWGVYVNIGDLAVRPAIALDLAALERGSRSQK